MTTGMYKRLTPQVPHQTTSPAAAAVHFHAYDGLGGAFGTVG